MNSVAYVNFFGDDAEFHHVGLAVNSIDKAYGGLEKFEDNRQKVTVSFIDLNNLIIELIEPLGDESPVKHILEKNQKLYHACYAVPDIEHAIKISRENGFHCIAPPVPATAFDNKKIAWVYSKVFGLFELVEK